MNPSFSKSYPGAWYCCPVELGPNKFGLVRAQGNYVILTREPDGTFLGQVGVDDLIHNLYAAGDGTGSVLATWQRMDGKFQWAVFNFNPLPVSHILGDAPSQAYCRAVPGGWDVCISRTANSYDRLALDPDGTFHSSTTFPLPNGDGASGFTYLGPDGEPRTYAVYGGLDETRLGAISVKQSQSDGLDSTIGTIQAHLNVPSPIRPHIAGDLNGFAIAAWSRVGGGASWFGTFNPPYLPDPTPQPETPPEPGPDGSIPDLGRVWIGAYKDSANTLPAANCRFTDDGGHLVDLFNHPIMYQTDDSRLWHMPDGTTLPGLYCYLDAGLQDLSISNIRVAMTDLIDQQLSKVAGKVVILAQFFDRSLAWKNEATLAAIPQCYIDARIKYGDRIYAILAFSGPDRAGGTGAHPVLGRWFQAIAAKAQPGFLVEPPEPTPVPDPTPVPEPTPEPGPVPEPPAPPIVPAPMPVPPPTPRPRGGLFWGFVRGLGSIFGIKVR